MNQISEVIRQSLSVDSSIRARAEAEIKNVIRFDLFWLR